MLITIWSNIYLDATTNNVSITIKQYSEFVSIFKLQSKEPKRILKKHLDYE
jgi:hypothetical protein